MLSRSKLAGRTDGGGVVNFAPIFKAVAEWQDAQPPFVCDFTRAPIVTHMPREPLAIPEGAMRVGPGSDAVVWRTCPDYKAEL